MSDAKKSLWDEISDLLERNADAWDGEEQSVQEEKNDLIADMQIFFEKFHKLSPEHHWAMRNAPKLLDFVKLFVDPIIPFRGMPVRVDMKCLREDAQALLDTRGNN